MNVFDRKYCIVDNVGNYYRLDEYDALVVADGEATAEWFDILEANKRISNSGMSKILRTVTANKNCIKKKKLQEFDKKDADSDENMESIDLVDLAKTLSYVQQNICQYQKKLRDQKTAVDEELCDIVHFIELYEHDDEKSLDLIQQIQDCRKKRRVIKDQMYKAEAFSKIFKTGGMESVLRDINHQMENMEIREYLPRQIPGLFVGATKQTSKSVDNAQYEEVEQLDYQDSEYTEDTMCYERHTTIFDETSICWEEMARQQRDFFANAKQYMINLQIDLEELDNQIEALMENCENMKCNVTQGYKMFKQIKELRLLRKEKIEELNKVSLIAGNFDCEAMADTYQYCIDTMTGESGQDMELESTQELYEENESQQETQLTVINSERKIEEAV